MFTVLKFCEVNMGHILLFQVEDRTCCVKCLCQFQFLHVCVFSNDGGGKLLCCKTAPCKHCLYWLPG